MNTYSDIPKNTIAFLALCKEYCVAVEGVSDTELPAFIDTMLRLLPRLYISAADIPQSDTDDYYVTQALTEDYYDNVRRRIECLMGEDDSYLEVFVDDMKYSDTPICASIAEGLADLFQVFYNILATIADDAAEPQVVFGVVSAARDDFYGYWSRILCNTLRAINDIKCR